MKPHGLTQYAPAIIMTGNYTFLMAVKGSVAYCLGEKRAAGWCEADAGLRETHPGALELTSRMTLSFDEVPPRYGRMGVKRPDKLAGFPQAEWYRETFRLCIDEVFFIISKQGGL